MTPRQVISKAGLRAGETLHGGRAFRGRVTALSRRRGPHWQAPGERGEGSGAWTGPRGAVIRPGLEVDDSPRVIGYGGLLVLLVPVAQRVCDPPGLPGVGVSIKNYGSSALNFIILPVCDSYSHCLYFQPLVTLWHIVPPMHYRSSCFTTSRASKQ